MRDLVLIAEIEGRLTQYITAEAAILRGQEYSIGNRSLTRPDLAEVRKAIIALRGQLEAAKRGGRIRVQRVVPRDV